MRTLIRILRRSHPGRLGLLLVLLASGGSPAIAQLSNPGPSELRPPTRPSTSPTTPSPPAPQKKPAPKPQPTEFPPNPLDLKGTDPLLPSGVPGRLLMAEERQQLAIALDKLNLEATEQYRLGERSKAFDTWNRELRLRRFQGLLPEVQALGRVGDVAWRQNFVPQVRYITQRLDTILAQFQQPKPPDSKPPDSKQSVPTEPIAPADRSVILEALGVSYQQVRSPASASAAYEQVITDARQRSDAAKVEATLLTLGQLYLNWFNYPKAADTYRELLTIAQSRSDQPNTILNLSQLAYTHEQAKQPQQAIPYQQQLLTLYQQSNTLLPIPALRIRLADNYQLAAQLDKAEQNYQEAYQLAQSQMQYGLASDALKKLGGLYRSNDRLDAALRVYDFLVGVEQQAYNTYGMMSAYDTIGQIYLSRKAYPQAIAAFQRALELARQLRYREDYFTAQIQKASQGK